MYAALEVKQNLSRDHVLYAGKKVASVRRLIRTSANIPYAGGVLPPRQPSSILGGFLAYQSDWSPGFGVPFTRALADLAADERLDLGCVLTEGAFEMTYSEQGRPAVQASPRDRSLVEFLFRLLRRLQEAATAPAIDFGAYLARFDASKGRAAIALDAQAGDAGSPR